MQITKREFLKQLGLGGAALVGGTALGDEFVWTKDTLPPGSCGDPKNVWFGKHIFPLEHTLTDGPSCFLKDGKVFEPAHELPVFYQTDVVVVGGGPAGFAAALGAARTGAKVALVERYGSLGGLFTNGMVLIVLSTSQHRGDYKHWDLMTRGVCEEFMQRAEKLGGDFSTARKPERHWQPTVDPEAAKYLMDKMIAEAGVEMFFHSWGVDVIQDGDKVLGVVFESKQGRQAILAKQVVDCTGDADLLFKAGGDYRQITHSIGFVTRLANLDQITATELPKKADGKPDRDFILKGNEGNKSAGWYGRLGNRGNGLDVRDLSKAEVAHRKYWWERVEKMRATPGWEKIYISNTCSQVGPRASRLVDTDVVLSRADIAAGKDRTATCVGWFGEDGSHDAFAVPYGQIVPKKVDNLLVAGRCLGTGDTIDTFRLIAPCFVTGHAAGVAAGLSARKGCAPRALPYKDLSSELLRQGAYLG